MTAPMTNDFVFVVLDVPGVGLVHGSVSQGCQGGVWSGDETRSNLPGHREVFALRDWTHPLSITSRVIREAKRIALQGNLR